MTAERIVVPRMEIDIRVTTDATMAARRFGIIAESPDQSDSDVFKAGLKRVARDILAMLRSLEPPPPDKADE